MMSSDRKSPTRPMKAFKRCHLREYQKKQEVNLISEQGSKERQKSNWRMKTSDDEISLWERTKASLQSLKPTFTSWYGGRARSLYTPLLKTPILKTLGGLFGQSICYPLLVIRTPKIFQMELWTRKKSARKKNTAIPFKVTTSQSTFARRRGTACRDS